MILTHNELYVAARGVEGDGVKNTIAGAAWRVCKTIFQEEDSIPNHAERISYAKNLLSDGGDGQLMKRMIRMVVVVLDKAAPYTDTEITNAINSIIDKIAIAN